MRLTRRAMARAGLAAPVGCGGNEPDLILHGGPIHTGVSAQPRVEALRITRSVIAFAGALEEARSRAGRAPRGSLTA